MVIYADLFSTTPYFYVLGMGAYTLGYLAFGISSGIFEWAGDAVGPAAGEMSAALGVVGELPRGYTA